jgi:AICAR transformylase/IMP cyclohydrolase PurH
VGRSDDLVFGSIECSDHRHWLLAIRENPEHEAAILAHGIAPIDLLVVNLYPFEATIEKGANFTDCIETIDIGGPAMITTRCLVPRCAGHG